MRHRAGYTLLELVVYAFLLLLAGLAVKELFTLGRTAQTSTLSSYMVSGQADTTLRWLHRDLQECALVSLRTYPNASNPNEPPGCSFASARSPSDQDAGSVVVSQYGAPLWDKTVFYTLIVPSGGRSGDLVRWEQPLTSAQKDFVPHPSSLMPSGVTPSDKTRRVVLHQVLAANMAVANLGGSPNYKSDQFGGFRVEFVQRIGGEGGDEQLTTVNPGDTSQPQDAANNTGVVDVTLQVLATDDYQPSLYCINFRAHPRY